MAGLQAYLAFTETVKHGNFAAAAREMGMSASAVAKSIARLEADLGLRLFHRTTRQVALTSDGRELYERCKRITDEIEALHDEAAGTRSEPSGTLRLNVPIVIGRQWLVPVLAQLTSRYPKLALDIAFSDRYADLIKDGLDAAVRIGHLQDTTLVAHQIGEQSLVVCGSPEYLKRCGTPRKPADLAQHACLLFRIPSTGLMRPWQFHDGRRNIELQPDSSVAMNDGEGLVAAAVAGMGLVQVPDIMTREQLRSGHLTEVLAAHRAPPTPISIVYPSARRITPKLRVLIDALSPSPSTPTRRSRPNAR